jgi:hypothetical protein
MPARRPLTGRHLGDLAMDPAVMRQTDSTSVAIAAMSSRDADATRFGRRSMRARSLLRRRTHARSVVTTVHSRNNACGAR